MRHFVRPPQPDFLRSSEAEDRRAQIAEYLRYAESVDQQRRPPLDRSFLNHLDLRAALDVAFRASCVYCETSYGAWVPASVAHHRPPGFAGNDTHETDFLHYVWLAYEWDNLYPVCERCSKHKENLFPVRNRRGPIHSTIPQLREIEGELLLDPCFHDPSEHLNFLTEGFVEARSEQGDATIAIINLNREDLVERRRTAFLIVSRLLIFGEGMEIERTGIDRGHGSEVIAGGRDHQGGVSLALLAVARQSGIECENLSQLLAHLSRLSRADRAEILGASAGPAVSGEKAASSAAPVEPAERRRSRAFRVDRQPLAKVPIEGVAIRNFKALKEIEFTLPVSVEDPELVPCMLLLGENAAGKSSVLEAMTLALLGTREAGEVDRLVRDDVKPRDVAYRPDLSDWESIPAETISVEVRFLSQTEKVQISAPGNAQEYEGSEEPAKVILAYGPRRFFTGRRTRRLRAPAHRVRSLFDPMATIANPLDWLLSCKDEDFIVAARTLRGILMLGPDAHFERDKAKRRFDIQTSNGPVPLAEMSVGYKSVIALATDIMRELMLHYDNVEFASAVVLIDEIETHLHPRWKMRIVRLLRQAFPKVQFIFTTHDPLCLRGMFDGEVFVLRRDPDTGGVIKLDELPSIRGMRAEQILMSEYFGLGSTDPETDAKLILYQNLVVRGVEGEEVNKLRRDIERTMMIGDTIEEQVFAEAMLKANIKPLTALGKVTSPPRRKMVEAILEKIENAKSAQVPEAGA